MKKILIALLLGMGLVSGALAQTHYTVQVGNGTASSAYVPNYTYYNYAYSQSLYRAGEVGIDGDIDTIYYEVNSGNASRGLKIYMAEVGQTGYVSASNAIAAGEFRQVFAGNVTWGAGWVAIPLDTVFSYQDTGSLVIAVIDTTGTWVPSASFKGTTMDGLRSVYAYSDYDTYNLGSPMQYVAPFLPNIRIGITSNSVYCASISNLTVSNIDQDSAHFSWTENGTATAWEVVVSDTAVTDFSMIAGTTVYSNSYTVTGLSGITEYHVYVRADCGGGSYSGWTETTFTSACIGYVPTPYTTGFEGLATGALPTCWQRILSGSSSAGTFPSVYAHAPNARTGDVYLELESNAGHTELLSLPPMEDISTLQLEMYVSANNANTLFEIGVMEDNAFVPVDTLALVANGGNWRNGYRQYTTYFNNYQGDGTRMAMRSSFSGSYTIMIDDLSVSEVPTCLQPTNATIAQVGSDFVTLTWRHDASAGAWEVYYDTVAMDSLMNGNLLQTYDDTVVINNLLGGTQYFFYIRTDCGGDYSAWVGPLTATPNVWNMRANQNDTIYMCGGIIYDDGGISGNYSNSQTSQLVVFPADSSMAVSLNGTYATENNWDKIYIYDGVGTAGTLLAECTGTGTIANLSSTVASGAVTIRMTSDGSVNSSGFAFTATCFSISCAAVDSLRVDSADMTEITLAWTTVGTENTWEIQYSTSDFVWGDSTATSVSVTGNPATITGLTADTRYYFAIAADCGDNTSVPRYISTRTACPGIVPVPYSTNLEDVEDGGIPGCWEQVITDTIQTAVYPAVYVAGSFAHSGSAYLEMTSETGQAQIIALPQMDSIGSLMMDFFATTFVGQIPLFEIGVMEDSTFVPVDTVTVATSTYAYNPTYLPYTTYLTGYAGSGDRIALRTSGSGGYTLFLDNFIVSHAPTCAPPTNFAAPSNTVTSITLSWTGNGASSWEIVYDTVDSIPGDSATGILATGTPYTVNGLAAGTTYHFFIRSVCGDNHSAWVGPLNATPGSWITRLGHSDTISVCGGIIYDNGGPEGDYALSSDDVLVIRPDLPGHAVTLTGSYDIEQGYDYLYIHDGEGTGSPLLGTYGGVGTLNVEATNPTGSLTLHFTSDFVFSYSGYALTVNCVDNSCPMPDSLTVGSVGGTTATINWLPGVASSWIVEYGVNGFTTGTGTASTVSTPTITLTGLNTATGYDVHVTPLCSASDTGRTAMISFRTNCQDGAINTFPWVENFEAGLDCWSQEYANGTTDWTTGSGNEYQATITAAQSGSSNAIFYAEDATSTYLVSPLMNLSSASEPVLMTFYHSQVKWANDQDTLGVYYRTCDTCGWNYVASWSNNITSWQLDSVLLPNPSATYQFAFLGFGDYGYGITLDSVVVYGPTSSCPAPVVTNVTADYQSISATWNGNADSYEVAIMPLASTSWPAGTTVSGNSHTFNGLSAATDYQFRLRAVCAEDDYSPWTVVTATTDSLPCFVPENLHTTNVDMNEVTVAWENNSLAETNTFVVRLYNNTTDVYDTVTGTSATFDGLYDNTNYAVTVQSLCAAGIASDWCAPIEFTTSSCEAPTNVVVSNVTTTSAVVSWTPGNNETSWEVSYGPSHFAQGDGTSIVVDNTTYTIDGLEPESNYDVYVRALCSETSHSRWSTVARFETLPETGIDNVDGDSRVRIYPNPASDVTTLVINGVEGRMAATLFDMSGRAIQHYQFECNGNCEQRIDIEGLANGTYFVRLTGDTMNSVSKVVVK